MVASSIERARSALLMVALASTAWTVEGAQAASSYALGTSASPTVGTSDAAAMATVAAPAAAAANTYQRAQYSTGGTGLRNRASGGITISGVVPPVKAAFLYWAVIDNGAAKASEASVTIRRVLPTPERSLTLQGKAVGSGVSPCWGGTGITVYKTTVPPVLANGNGSYKIILGKGSYGSGDGGDPWTPPVAFPLWDGASLVVVGTGTSRVSIFDKGLSGSTYKGALSYSLPLAAAAGGAVLFEDITADGQIGVSRLAQAGIPAKTTYINGVAIAGPGSTARDSDYDGSSGLPLPLLWDDVGRDVTSAASGRRTLEVSIISQSGIANDCNTPVANIVQY